MSNNNSLNDSMQSFNTSTSTPSNSNKLNKKPRYAFNQGTSLILFYTFNLN